MKMTTSSEINLVGLHNLGNTCYMNASLQCLCRDEAFRMYFLDRPVPSGEICLKIAELCRVLSSGTEAVLPVAFKIAISKCHAQYEGTNQQDAHEFLLHLLNCLQDEMKKWPSYCMDMFIQKNFYCEEMKMITCKNCGEITVTYEEPSPVTSISLTALGKSISLLKCLKNYCFGQSIEDYSCSSCNSKSEGIQKSSFSFLAPTMIIHLKRFSVEGGRVHKDKRPVECPLEFTPQALFWEGIPNTTYKLVGFLCHYGEGLNAGHYIAYHKINERWFRFNDSEVTEVPLAELNTSFAYILFYSIEQKQTASSDTDKVTTSRPPSVVKTGTGRTAPGHFLPLVKFVTGEEIRKRPLPTKKTSTLPRRTLQQKIKVPVPSVKPPNKPHRPPLVKFITDEEVRRPGQKMKTTKPPQAIIVSPEKVDESQIPDSDVGDVPNATINTQTQEKSAVFSDYVSNLDSDTFRRYLKKIAAIGFVDPYTLVEKTSFPKPETLPDVSFGDIFYYFVVKTSMFTASNFRAYKSLNSYNAFICGWIKSMWIEHFAAYVLVMGKVMHSQRLNEKPLSPWVIVRESGEIESAHCTCMAGLAEACSHAATLLFYVEDRVRTHHNPSVTEVPAYWVGTSKRPVEFKRVKDIDFSQPLKKMEERIGAKEKPARKLEEIPILTKNEKHAFLKNLIDQNCDVAALTVTLPFCSQLKNRDSAMLANYPPALRQLNNAVYRNIPAEQLWCVGLSLDLSVTEEQANALEKATKKQASSKLWFRYRAGRVTASKFKSVCRTNTTKPSLSLVKTICYPDQYKFSTKATQWGCQHEKTARNAYIADCKRTHKNFSCEDSGLFINPQYPQFGASPDGLLFCECCGEGCVEVKCPHCLRSKDKADILTTKTCLVSSGDSACLDVEHAYYFQVQMQLFVSGRDYCDFVLWTRSVLFVQRIYPDKLFWDRHSRIATDFFYGVLVPEMLGKCFTQSQESTKAVLCSPRKQASKYVVSSYQENSSVTAQKTVASSPQRDAWKWIVTQISPETPSPRGIFESHQPPGSVLCSPRSEASKWVVSPITDNTLHTAQRTIACSPQTDAFRWEVTECSPNPSYNTSQQSSESRRTMFSTKPGNVVTNSSFACPPPGVQPLPRL